MRGGLALAALAAAALCVTAHGQRVRVRLDPDGKFRPRQGASAAVGDGAGASAEAAVPLASTETRAPQAADGVADFRTFTVPGTETGREAPAEAAGAAQPRPLNEPVGTATADVPATESDGASVPVWMAPEILLIALWLYANMRQHSVLPAAQRSGLTVEAIAQLGGQIARELEACETGVAAPRQCRRIVLTPARFRLVSQDAAAAASLRDASPHLSAWLEQPDRLEAALLRIVSALTLRDASHSANNDRGVATLMEWADPLPRAAALLSLACRYGIPLAFQRAAGSAAEFATASNPLALAGAAWDHHGDRRTLSVVERDWRDARDAASVRPEPRAAAADGLGDSGDGDGDGGHNSERDAADAQFSDARAVLVAVAAADAIVSACNRLWAEWDRIAKVSGEPASLTPDVALTADAAAVTDDLEMTGLRRRDGADVNAGEAATALTPRRVAALPQCGTAPPLPDDSELRRLAEETAAVLSCVADRILKTPLFVAHREAASRETDPATDAGRLPQRCGSLALVDVRAPLCEAMERAVEAVARARSRRNAVADAQTTLSLVRTALHPPLALEGSPARGTTPGAGAAARAGADRDAAVDAQQGDLPLHSAAPPGMHQHLETLYALQLYLGQSHEHATGEVSRAVTDIFVRSAAQWQLGAAGGEGSLQALARVREAEADAMRRLVVDVCAGTARATAEAMAPLMHQFGSLAETMEGERRRERQQRERASRDELLRVLYSSERRFLLLRAPLVLSAGTLVGAVALLSGTPQLLRQALDVLASVAKSLGLGPAAKPDDTQCDHSLCYLTNFEFVRSTIQTLKQLQTRLLQVLALCTLLVVAPRVARHAHLAAILTLLVVLMRVPEAALWRVAGVAALPWLWCYGAFVFLWALDLAGCPAALRPSSRPRVCAARSLFVFGAAPALSCLSAAALLPRLLAP